MVDREILVYRRNKYTYSFKDFRKIKINPFGRNINNCTITLKEADQDHSSLLVEIMNFRSKIKPQNPKKKQKKNDILKNLHALFDCWERVFDPFESRTFPKNIEGKGFSELDRSNLKILTPKQMLRRLLIALARVKTRNTSEDLLNGIR